MLSLGHLYSVLLRGDQGHLCFFKNQQKSIVVRQSFKILITVQPQTPSLGEQSKSGGRNNSTTNNNKQQTTNKKKQTRKIKQQTTNNCFL